MAASTEYIWRKFSELDLHEFYQIIMAREAVFVVEQTCPYQETDELDPACLHLQLLHDGKLAAYARVIPPGLKCEYPSIGRVMTVKGFRDLGLGRKLMCEAIRFCQANYPKQTIQISAQVYLKAFYQSLGFEACSEEYDEDGIPHLDMLLAP